MRNLLLLYIFGFMFPFVYNIFEGADNSSSNEIPAGRIIRYGIAATVQLFFLLLEYAELKYSGVHEYF